MKIQQRGDAKREQRGNQDYNDGKHVREQAILPQARD
jgi:hypothetical protein